MLRKAGGAKRFRALAYVSARSMMLLANSGKALQRSPSCPEFGFGVRFQAEVPAASDMTAEFANSIVLWRHPNVGDHIASNSPVPPKRAVRIGLPSGLRITRPMLGSPLFSP